MTTENKLKNKSVCKVYEEVDNVTDLICVLLLSGVQKNDLDVNTLRKLEQRNVNIHDVNNEELGSECLQNDGKTRMQAEEVMNALLKNTPVQVKTKELKYNTIVNKEYENYNQKSIGNTSIMMRDRRTATTGQFFEEPTKMLINSYHTNEITTESEPKLEKVINFWQTLVKRNRKMTTDSSIIKKENDISYYKFMKIENTTPSESKIEKPQNLKVMTDNDLENANIVEGGYLNNMLSEYITQQKTSIQTSTTTKRSDDIGIENESVNLVTDDDSDIFKYLLNAPDKESSETHNINGHLSKYSYEFNFSKRKYPNKKSEHGKNRRQSFEDDEDLNNIFVRDFDFMKSNKELENDKQTTIQHLLLKNERTDNTRGERSKNIYNLFNYSTTTLPSEIIKKIAEDVKALVLKDLNKDMGLANSTVLYVTTTKGPTSTTPRNQEEIRKKKFETSYVIDKIMEILQKYKTEKESDVMHTTEQNNEKKVFYTQKIVYPPLLPPIDNYAMKPATNLPQLNYSLKSAQHTKKVARLKLDNPKQKPFNPIRSLPPHVNSVNSANIFKTMPLTIQTNLNEIPPLSVSVSNPLALVSHNIIISTRRPLHNKLRYVPTGNNKLVNNKKSVIGAAKRIREEKLPKERIQNDKDYDDSDVKNVIKFKIMDNEGSENYDYENLRSKYYKSHRDSFNRLGLHNQNNIQRFHEKLEKYQPKVIYEDADEEDCCKDAIFQREQRPLTDMNRRDDTSFKKLLRTQQKVTDMLERMLAKTKLEQPLSVETT
ncbi:unnamed protein product [Parnassius mnemosyne]|uniref:Uncharacterized protein n=1 Tax=Parnassius mnemosyne TaxID=213953 RepID=A0AAV1KNG0_9NEOP